MNQRAPSSSGSRRWIALATRSVVGIGALLLAVVVYVVLASTAPQPESVGKHVMRTKVPVIELSKVEVARQWRGQGTAQPMVSADVPARVSATVERIPEGIDAGVPVKKGQLLIELDAADFQRQVEIAEQTLKELRARLDQLEVQQQRLSERRELERQMLRIARDELERVRKIYDQGATGRQSLDVSQRSAIESERALTTTLEQLDSIGPQQRQVEATIASQESSLALARLNLGRCTIASPIDGVIQSLEVEVGEHLQVGQRLARVVGLSSVEVPLNVPAAARADLALGDPVTLRSASRGDQQWEAKVSRVLPEDDPTSRTTTFFAEFHQPEAERKFGTAAMGELLMPGAFVSGIVTSDQKQPRWVVPRRSIRNGRVLLVRDGVVQSCDIEADFTLQSQFPRFGVSDDQWVVLQPGGAPFTEGDLLIIDASLGLSDGAQVEPTQAPGGGASSAASGSVKGGGAEGRGGATP